MTSVEDVRRRDVIAEYALQGRSPQPDLQGLAQVAATVTGSPKAAINVIDDRFQHVIAAVGVAPAVCAREDSMCGAVFQEGRLVVVDDARTDDRFRENPFVTGEIARVRFYASSPLITPDGVVIGTLCVFDDTVRTLDDDAAKALELLAHQVVDVLELRRLTDELGRSNEQLSRFAGQVSHDLVNPLTAITGFLEMAADSVDVDDARAAVHAIARAESAAERMSGMLSSLLSYARIGGSRLDRTLIDLETMMAAIMDDLDAPLTDTGAELEIVGDAPLYGDPTLTRVLVQNLVSNAVKFTTARGSVPFVRIASEPVEGGTRLTVDDNGPGVRRELRERVFRLMERGDAENVPGSGIGLSTCRRIVQAHEGRIGIDDSAAGGARVWVVLPDAADGSATAPER